MWPKKNAFRCRILWPKNLRVRWEALRPRGGGGRVHQTVAGDKAVRMRNGLARLNVKGDLRRLEDEALRCMARGKPALQQWANE